ncbi:hypothetical protein OROMI_013300 [Orobanche minor]
MGNSFIGYTRKCMLAYGLVLGNSKEYIVIFPNANIPALVEPQMQLRFATIAQMRIALYWRVSWRGFVRGRRKC